MQPDTVGNYIRSQVDKLLEVVTDYMREFVGILVRATVIFYQLDVKSGETTEVLLHNLLTSLTLKNPVYSRIFELIRSSCRLPMKQIEDQLEAVKDRRD